MREVKAALLPGEAEDADESPQGVTLTVVVLRHFEAMLSAWGALTLEPSPAAAKHQSEVSLAQEPLLCIAWNMQDWKKMRCLDQPCCCWGMPSGGSVQHIIVVAPKVLLDGHIHRTFWPTLQHPLQLPLDKTSVSVPDSCGFSTDAYCNWPMVQLHLLS